MRGPAAKPLRLVLVSGAAGPRAGLLEALERAPAQIVAQVSATRAAVQACQELRPDVVLVDAALEPNEGLAAVQDIMAFAPRPILVLDENPASTGAFRALALGALDVMPGPRGQPPTYSQELASRLRLLAGVRVITHVRGRRARAAPSPRSAGFRVVGIAASLGGPRALSVLLKALPRDLAAPVCIVQHISTGFSKGLAAWLASETGWEVKEAVAGECLRPGAVRVAPSEAHLKVGERDRVVLDRGEPVGGFRPSATVLFTSLAGRYGPRAIGVVLTGMGRDGAEGLLAIRTAGGSTLAQDEATSAVYGMPRAAVEAGAAERVLPLEEMGAAIGELARVKPEGGRAFP